MKKMNDADQAGVKDHGLLESAVHRPQQSVFGEDAYPDLFDKAAALLESLVKNHCFHNGNNRTHIW
ncbi:Toxin Doc [compost metagenome]